MSDPTSLSLTHLLKALDDGAFSVEEVMVSFLDRIDRFNPKINALVSLRSRDILIAEARVKDAERQQGIARGSLHGVPVAIKDLSEAKGILCTYGSPLFHDYVPDFDDIQVERIRAAGAIIIGKTNTPEWGFGSHSYNPVFGVTRNPWDLTRSAGGSSGGAGPRLPPVSCRSPMAAT